MKQEIKILKIQSNKVIDEISESVISEETSKKEAKDKQKEVVLGDIRNLITEYKKERKLSQRA